ncbi:MAG: DUF4129 domain-containing protein [Actinomycetota bacterium]
MGEAPAPARARHRRSGRPAAVLALTVVAAMAVSVAAPAAAEDVTTSELQRLARRAGSDPAALERLRAVDRVDGRPLDVGRALGDAGPEELRARLDALGAGAAPAAGPDPTAVRDEARRILEGRRFNRSSVPRPLRGVLRRLGDLLRPVGEPLGRAWDRVTDDVWATGALAAAVVGLAALASARLARRRTSAGVHRSGPGGRPNRALDPERLEREALAAERAGDLDRALRLRFRAGVVRLDRAGVVVDRPALTTGELTRRLGSSRLRELADAFEEVAYGGRPATAGDVDDARAGWPRVLEEAAGR